MEYPAAEIDRCSIERANGYAKALVDRVLRRARDYAEDPMRNQRLDASECVACHYRMRVGGATTPRRPCGICGRTIRSPNTDIGVMCAECAKANGLCKHCGADVELKTRRKSRPYEAGKEEAKHTPGPWRTSTEGRIYSVYQDNEDGEDIGGVVWWPTADNRDDESLANARLMAAAPDLLAACEALLAACEALLAASEGRTSRPLDMAREAVAKATEEAK